MAAVRASPELVALGKDGRDQERFTSRDMIATEARLERAGDELAGADAWSRRCGGERSLRRSPACAREEQQAAFEK
jgi:hypothetical protein